jgi:hypothetical protein
VRRAAWLLVLAACDAPAEPRASLVDAPTVIAVAIRPAEAEPGAEVTATVTVATPDGTDAAADAGWALCTSPRPVTDNNAVAAACLDDGPTPVGGGGASVRLTLSRDACALFGPDPPPGGFRPRDPDASGGYYQPVRVEVGDLVGFGMARIHCPLANAPLEVSQAYAAGYANNDRPRIDSLDVVPAAVAPGDTVDLVVRWPDTTAEPYLRYDVATETLVRTIEDLTVSWFATGGALDLDRTVGFATGSAVRWTAPDADATIWAVVRDSRGGVAVAELAVAVSPR